MGSGRIKQRQFVIGDIHGAWKALDQCLKRSGFSTEHDILYSLGDVTDGWPETARCIEALMQITHLRYIQGNHDVLALEWMQHGTKPTGWQDQGGEATIKSYPDGVPDTHIAFIRDAPRYIIDQNRLFVHGGIDPFFPFHDQNPDTFLWDRTLYYEAVREKEKGRERQLTEFKEVFIGHTPIHRSGHLKPQKACEVWMMDTGAGWEGVLSMMDINSYKVYTSDPVPELYPGFPGRRKNQGD